MRHINYAQGLLSKRPELESLREALDFVFTELRITGATIYYDFPIFREDGEELLKTPVAAIAPSIGLVLINTTIARSPGAGSTVAIQDEQLDRLYSQIYSRLLRTPELRNNRTSLAVPLTGVIYAPAIFGEDTEGTTNSVVTSRANLLTFFRHLKERNNVIPDGVYNQLVGTFQGARGLVRAKTRKPVTGSEHRELVEIFDKLETAMAGFDVHQSEGYISEIDGPQRIRGLAGSGKTVVLAMKAALTHLRHPEARILYTFHTKSLYQHVKRTITKFYREYDDKDPDWDRIVIQHSWGGPSIPGVYYSASMEHGQPAMNFREAYSLNPQDALGAACAQLMSQVKVRPSYDYVFIDEGQDFSPHFIQLCARLSTSYRFVLAYDELQTIFRPTAPSSSEVLGDLSKELGRPLDFERDIVLPVCYRNPREVLVAAHAVGFGIYGEIVQMLEDREHWETIGYDVIRDNFVEGGEVVVTRPERNSLSTVSSAVDAHEIVKAKSFRSFYHEVEAVVTEIIALVRSGVRPDDILVAAVDDRHARRYLDDIENGLSDAEVMCNNIHQNKYGIPDFYVQGQVTLSTIHKAKGNEAFVVFVVGADAVFEASPTVIDRNLLFTAITRAKALVRVYGVGVPAQRLCEEIDEALAKFPNLEFTYMGPERIRRVRKDWKRKVVAKRKASEKLEQLLREFDVDEIVEMLQRRTKSESEE